MKSLTAAWVCLVVILGATPATKSVAEIILIDEFDDGGFVIQANSGTPSITDSQSSLSNVVGGRRDSQVDWTSGPKSVLLAVITDPGILAYSSDVLTDGMAMLTYPGLDLNASGFMSIDLDVLSSDLGPVPIAVTLTDGGGGMATGMGTTPSPAPGTLSIPSSEFPGVDFSDIDEIKVTLDPPMEFDISLDAIRIIVPEPGSMLLFSTLLLGLAVWGRSRSRA